MAKKKSAPVRPSFKIQSVEEFLANGGKITKVPPSERPVEPEVVKKTTAGAPAVLMTLEEADLFYGEPKKNAAKPKKPKTSLNIDLDALPEALRAKFISKLKEENSGEDFQENEEDEE
jgi:hypothetical protein